MMGGADRLLSAVFIRPTFPQNQLQDENDSLRRAETHFSADSVSAEKWNSNKEPIRNLQMPDFTCEAQSEEQLPRVDVKADDHVQWSENKSHNNRSGTIAEYMMESI